MRSPPVRLIQRGFSTFDLFEFILPLVSLGIGLGIINRASVRVDISAFLQTIIFFILLEFGSQFFDFYRREFISTPAGRKDQKEKFAAFLIVILFWGVSIIPLSRVLLDSHSSPAFFTIIAISIVYSVIFRAIDRSVLQQILSVFLFVLNNAFFLPVSQVIFYGLEINVLFTTLSQISFLCLLGFLMIKEIFKIEMQDKPSRIVALIGTIPLMRIALTTQLLGWLILVTYVIRRPNIGLILLAVVAGGVLLMMLSRILNLDRLGKPALAGIYNLSKVLLALQYLGWGIFLWVL